MKVCVILATKFRKIVDCWIATVSAKPRNDEFRNTNIRYFIAILVYRNLYVSENK